MSFSLYKNKAVIDAGKFVAHDLEIVGVSTVAVKSAEGVAAIELYLGI